MNTVLYKDEHISCSTCEGKLPLQKNIILLITGGIFFIAGLLTFRHPGISLTFHVLAWFSAGAEVLHKAISNIFRDRIFNENLLMSLATIGALATGQYAEAAAVMLFYKVGIILEDLAVDNSKKSIAGLMDLRPGFANLLTDSGIVRVEPAAIKIGDKILVKAGERIPVDSIVLEGESIVDTSPLTGESMPKTTSVGDKLLGGFINKTGLLTLQAKNSLQQSALSRVLELVEDAAGKKAPTEKFISKFASYYTPVVTAAAFLLAFFPPILTGTMDFQTWLYRSMIFLVISCPCALVVSIPLSFFAGIGKASSKGILVKGGNYLEALNAVDTVVFDKTGTLTEGVFKVTGMSPVNCTEDELLGYAAYAEANSTHPIAVSIVKAYGKPVDTSLIEKHEESAGKGVRVSLSGHTIAVGNMDFIISLGITPVSARDGSETTVYVVKDGEYKGWIEVADTLKKDAVKAVEGLRKKGIHRFIMLTGDAHQPARAIAHALGLDEYHHNLLPHQKVDKMKDIMGAAKGKVLFAGDGINDAPVLALADIGVSMGGIGSDAAVEASDIVLMKDEPSKLADALTIAGITKKIALQNIIFAMLVKGLVLVLGALGFATMWGAVFADVGVTMLAIINAMRIRYHKL